jgi:hypothetical protein
MPLSREEGSKCEVRNKKEGNHQRISKNIGGGGTAPVVYSVDVGILRNQEFANFKVTTGCSRNQSCTATTGGSKKGRAYNKERKIKQENSNQQRISKTTYFGVSYSKSFASNIAPLSTRN